MSVVVEAVIGGLGFVLLMVSVVGLAAGCAAALDGERLERCPRCHRVGLAAGTAMHVDGCPHRLRAWVANAAHLAHRAPGHWATGLHVRH